MSIKDLLKFVDPKLSETFNQKGFDAAKARKPILRSIDTTAGQFASATPTRGRKMFKVANGVVAYTPGFKIEGQETLYVPSERFTEFLTAFRATVESGELDKALEDRSKDATDAPKTSNRGGAGKARGPWSEARRAAYEARKAKA